MAQFLYQRICNLFVDMKFYSLLVPMLARPNHPGGLARLRHSVGAIGIILLGLSSCTNLVRLTVVEPPVVYVPLSIKSVAVVNRTITTGDNKVVDVIDTLCDKCLALA